MSKTFIAITILLKRVLNNLISNAIQAYDKKPNKKIEVTNEDLLKAGMPPEFLGRIPIVTSTEELELEDLVEILDNYLQANNS